MVFCVSDGVGAGSDQRSSSLRVNRSHFGRGTTSQVVSMLQSLVMSSSEVEKIVVSVVFHLGDAVAAAVGVGRGGFVFVFPSGCRHGVKKVIIFRTLLQERSVL